MDLSDEEPAAMVVVYFIQVLKKVYRGNFWLDCGFLNGVKCNFIVVINLIKRNLVH